MKKKATGAKAVTKASVKPSTRAVAKIAKKSSAKVSRETAPKAAKKSSAARSSAVSVSSLADDLAALRRRRFNA